MASLLERDGVRCWYAARDITGGEEWAAEIMDAINRAGLLVLVFSGHSNASHQVRREMDLATSRELPIIPFRIEDVEPHPALRYYMAGAHWMDALTPPMEARIKGLADAARRLLARPVPKFAASEAAAARFVEGIAEEAESEGKAPEAEPDTPADPAQRNEHTTRRIQEAPYVERDSRADIGRAEAASLTTRVRWLGYAGYALGFASVLPILLFISYKGDPLPVLLAIGVPVALSLLLLFLRRQAQKRLWALDEDAAKAR